MERADMKALLICPSERPAVSAWAEAVPLALVPLFGKRLLEYWLEHLATRGASHIQVLAVDRPDEVRNWAGDGSRWGVRLDVVPESRQLSPAEARAKYRTSAADGWMPSPDDVTAIESLPGQTDCPLFTSYEAWFRALEAYWPRLGETTRLGMRELQPGIWVSSRCRLAPTAVLRAPCWLGNHVSVGPRSVVGPMAILEDRVIVSALAEVVHTQVGPETFVGELTELRNSLAWGNSLINWLNGSCAKVPDAFLLSSLSTPKAALKPVGWLARAAALGFMALTSPAALYALLKARLGGYPALKRHRAVRPASGSPAAIGPAVAYYEFNRVNRWLQRWPQLWNIGRGEFAWIGNRPLNRAQAASLSNEYEHLWLAAPIGLYSLADAEACAEPFGDDALAHAAFYAVQAHGRLHLTIAGAALRLRIGGKPGSAERPDLLVRLPTTLAEHRSTTYGKQ
jgi:hypothetical protein